MLLLGVLCVCYYVMFDKYYDNVVYADMNNTHTNMNMNMIMDMHTIISIISIMGRGKVSGNEHFWG